MRPLVSIQVRVGFRFLGKLSIELVGKPQNGKAASGSFANVDAFAGGRRDAFNGNIFRHYETHLHCRIGFVILHENTQEHPQSAF